MDTMLIELTHEKSASLLHNLEELNLIRVLQTNHQPKQNLSSLYAGSLPVDIANELQAHVAESRKEWNKSI